MGGDRRVDLLLLPTDHRREICVPLGRVGALVASTTRRLGRKHVRCRRGTRSTRCWRMLRARSCFAWDRPNTVQARRQDPRGARPARLEPSRGEQRKNRMLRILQKGAGSTSTCCIQSPSWERRGPEELQRARHRCAPTDRPLCRCGVRGLRPRVRGCAARYAASTAKPVRIRST